MPDYFTNKLRSLSGTLNQTPKKNALQNLRLKRLFLAFICAMLGTLVPHPLLNVISSLAALGTGSGLFAAWWVQGRPAFQANVKLALVLIFASQAFGCAQIMADSDPADVSLFQTPLVVKQKACWSLVVCGIDTQPVTLKELIEEMGIEKALVVFQGRSYGIVGMKKVMVVGV